MKHHILTLLTLFVFVAAPRAAAQDSNEAVSADSILEEAKMLEQSGQHEDAFYAYRKAAKLGNPIAELKVSDYYFEKNNVSEALRWLKISADHNNATACYILGSRYFSGDGVKKDYREFIRWMEKGADLGDRYCAWIIEDYCERDRVSVGEDKEAFSYYVEKAQKSGQLELTFAGKYLVMGKGTTCDVKSGVSMLERASEAGCGLASYYLSYFYANKIGVKKSPKKAEKYLSKAAMDGYYKANYAKALNEGKFSSHPKKRSEKDIEKMVKSTESLLYKEKYVTTRYSNKQNELLLSNVPADYLTPVEKMLLTRYKEVAISGPAAKWYYVIDNEDWVGMCGLDGSPVMDPAPGRMLLMCSGFNFMLVGDRTDDEALTKQLKMYLYSAAATPTGYGVGVMDYKKGKWFVEPGKYDVVSFARRTGANVYYVAKADPAGELKWGLIKQNGKTIIPVQYKSVGVEGGKFIPGNITMLYGGKYVGRNDMTMAEFAQTKYDRYQTAIGLGYQIAGALQSFGNTLISAAEAMPGGSGSGSYSGSTVRTGASKGASRSTGTVNSGHNASEMNSFNADRNTYHKCETLLINMSTSSSYDYSDDVRKSTQSQMKNIRQKWASRGLTINQSSWETWGGK